MGSKTREVGGGPAVGLGEDWVRLLRSGLFGSFGGQPTAGDRFNQANPVGSTMGIAGFLDDLLSGGGGRLGGALATNIENQNTRNIADLRSRFGAAGGQSFGTPAAYAESLYRAEAAPRAATAIGGLQLQALLPLLGLMGQTAGLGIPQRSVTIEPGLLAQLLPGLAGAATGAGNLMQGIATL